MNCEECREKVGRLLERDWEASSPLGGLTPDLEEHAAQCDRCAPLIEAARALLTGEMEQIEPPAGLADRVADRILAEESPSRRGLRLFRAGSTKASRFVLQTAAAIFLVVASAFVTTMIVSPGDQEVDPVVTVRLELRAPEAQQVAVVGDWNGWDPTTHPMTDSDNDGIWEINVQVRRDQEYQYQFLINGEEWIPDPEAPMTVSDGFGGKNSVLNI